MEAEKKVYRDHSLYVWNIRAKLQVILNIWWIKVGRFGIAISSSLSFVSVQAAVATPSVGGPHIPESLSSSTDAQIASATALLTTTVMMESGETCYNLHRFKGRSSTHEAQPVIEPEELMTKDIARTDSWDRAERVGDMGQGIDLATTLERIEKKFVIPDPRLPDSPIMIHLMELSNPDPYIGRPGYWGRNRHTCIAIRDVSKLKSILDKAGS
ncbi:LOV domain-containing protein [Artemisia annua]|uniref:LOV domain-containing protein n=1 Tax=Artemisia annua TaxID=35608 RepID=A0A2U1NWR0_ARTAN|nr:LOV domain-containing protein [Artemisia annua]